MFPPSKEAAREIIDSIREQNGGITPADRENTPEGVLRALESIQKRLGAATQMYCCLNATQSLDMANMSAALRPTSTLKTPGSFSS